MSADTSGYPLSGLFAENFSAIGYDQQGEDAGNKETEICGSPGFLIQEYHASGNKYYYCDREHNPGNDMLPAGKFFQVPRVCTNG